MLALAEVERGGDRDAVDRFIARLPVPEWTADEFNDSGRQARERLGQKLEALQQGIELPDIAPAVPIDESRPEHQTASTTFFVKQPNALKDLHMPTRRPSISFLISQKEHIGSMVVGNSERLFPPRACKLLGAVAVGFAWATNFFAYPKSNRPG